MKIREGEYPYSKRQMQSDPLPDPVPGTSCHPNGARTPINYFMLHLTEEGEFGARDWY